MILAYDVTPGVCSVVRDTAFMDSKLTWHPVFGLKQAIPHLHMAQC